MAGQSTNASTGGALDHRQARLLALVKDDTAVATAIGRGAIEGVRGCLDEDGRHTSDTAPPCTAASLPSLEPTAQRRPVDAYRHGIWQVARDGDLPEPLLGDGAAQRS